MVDKKAIFLDRDGVINREKKDYVTKLDDLEILHDVGINLKKCQDEGFIFIIITNQSAINRGLLSHTKLAEIHDLMKKKLSNYGIKIEGIYYCPHRPDENCKCRKPNSLMISHAISDFSINPTKSWFIGDKESDLEPAKKLGINTFKINTNGSLFPAVKKIITETNS